MSTDQATFPVKRISKYANCEPITYLISIIYHIINAVLLQKVRTNCKIITMTTAKKAKYFQQIVGMSIYGNFQVLCSFGYIGFTFLKGTFLVKVRNCREKRVEEKFIRE